MPKGFYVYVLLDPRKSDQPFYVGKGQNDRAWHHLSRWKNVERATLKARVIARIYAAGLVPKIDIFRDNMTEADAHEVESSLIQQYGRRDFDRGGILLNVTLGGEGTSGRKCSPETKAKIAAAVSISQRARISKLSEDERKMKYGHARTTQQKIENAIRKRREWAEKSDEEKQKWADTRRLLRHSGQTKQKISDKLKAALSNSMERDRHKERAQKAAPKISATNKKRLDGNPLELERLKLQAVIGGCTRWGKPIPDSILARLAEIKAITFPSGASCGR